MQSMRTLEQERARYAWQCINEVRNQSFASDYRSIAVKMPSLILTNGLGQTLAFLKAKGKGNPSDEHEVFYQHISNWLKQQLKLTDDLLEWIVNYANSQQYRLATMEALALLQWLRRFAEAILPKGEE
ncbi:MAG: type III-B CRISPR module-associated protein Cmr5 [Archaeoglobaceae archaeon]